MTSTYGHELTFAYAYDKTFAHYYPRLQCSQPGLVFLFSFTKYITPHESPVLLLHFFPFSHDSDLGPFLV